MSINTIHNKNYKIIVNSKSINDLTILDKIEDNENYSKYNMFVKGEIIIYNSTEIDEPRSNKTMIKETYEKYLTNNIHNNAQWILNIINGITEQDDIIYKDDCFILIPNVTFKKYDKLNTESFHILAIIKNYIKSLRDLTSDHIELLEYIYKTSIEKIKEIYDIDHNKLKVYIHYPPSTWHLHIHFCTIDNINSSSAEYTYMLDQVIFNLKLYSDYYKKAPMFIYK